MILPNGGFDLVHRQRRFECLEDAVVAGGVQGDVGRWRGAVTSAIMQAKADDVVLIAGKGHEDYQLVGNRRLDYSDRVTVARLRGFLAGGCAGGLISAASWRVAS